MNTKRFKMKIDEIHSHVSSHLFKAKKIVLDVKCLKVNLFNYRSLFQIFDMNILKIC